MPEIEQLVSQAVQSILIAARPEEIPEDVPVHALGDLTVMNRPCFIAFCEDVTQPHPALARMVLVLRLSVRPDETAPATAAVWHAAAARFFNENSASLAATLEPHGYALQRFLPTGSADTLKAKRGEELDQRWTVWVRAL